MCVTEGEMGGGMDDHSAKDEMGEKRRGCSWMRGGGKGYRVSCPVPSPPPRKVTNEGLHTTSKNPSPQEVQTLALWRFIYKKEREKKKAMEECFALTHTR